MPTYAPRTHYLRFLVRMRQNARALRNLPPFLRLIWRVHPPYAAANVSLRIVKALLPLAMLYIGKLLIDEIVSLVEQGATSVPSYIWQLLVLELVLALVSELCSRIINLLDGLLGDLFSNRSSIDLMEHAARLDLAQFENPKFYDKMERARRQTSGRTMLMGQVLAQGEDLISLIALGVSLVVYNPWLVLILVVAVLPSLAGEIHYNQKAYALNLNWTRERRELDYLRYLGANDYSAKEVKSYGLSPFLVARFRKLADAYFEANKSLSKRRTLWSTLFAALGSLAYYGAYALIVVQTVGGPFTVGDLTFLSGAFSRMRGLLQSVVQRFTRITRDALYLNDFFDFFALQPQSVASTRSAAAYKALPHRLEQGFRFEHVGFRYPGSDQWAVRDISFSIGPEEKIAVVGENGAGKTTLVKLLARLYEPEEGRILLDGVDLRAFDADEVRRAVRIIFQDFERYQFPVSDNIAVGASGARLSPEQLQQAAHSSLADEVIGKLPHGYAQMLGRRFNGVELSGGQWQKIALSRIYAQDARLLILDEPTAALDARAEKRVFDHFTQQVAHRAAVLISHRFSTVRMADRILYLSQGRLVEEGSHEALLKHGGRYAELFQLQAQGYR